jgi:hypothetical protein
MALFGYFQSEQYFISHRDYVNELFAPPQLVEDYIIDRYFEIDFDDAVSVHVRRGDYLKFADVHPACSSDYYNLALEDIGAVNNILVFSDDIDWCRSNLDIKNALYITEEDYIELYMMSFCRNNIIANSSFSWWAAWLGDSDKRVIAPSVWFGPKGPQDVQDIVPERWKRI